MAWINLNGKKLDSANSSLQSDNRGFRFGDGFFETMRVANGEILLEKLHEARMQRSLDLLKFIKTDHVSFENLKNQIIELCEKNGCLLSARIRLSFFRGNGALSSNQMPCQYLIEAGLLDEPEYNSIGLDICIYRDAIISRDKFSGLKSANYLPYVMASLFAQEQKKDEAFVINVSGNIAESSIANVFWVKDQIVYTPGLNEGCIDGVMRKFLIEKLKSIKFKVIEKPFTEKDLFEADEVFLTNAVKGIRWVGQFESKKFGNSFSSKIYNHFLAKGY